jgi:ABC-2 type transport system ATP-binding protein
MIRLENVTKIYGNITAVNNLNLTVEKGEVVGLLGPNGAGKSTTMKIISGFLIPDTGKVSINETDIREDPLKAKMSIGYMPENNPLYKDLLVREALEHAFKIRKMKWKREWIMLFLLLG